MMGKSVMLLALLSLGAVQVAFAEIYFQENFDDGKWEERWVKSQWKPESDIGEWKLSAGEFYASPEDKGLKTSEDARFYGISAKMDKEFDNLNKNLIVQFSVKHEQNIDCGGAYIKLLPAGLDQSNFGGDSPYSIMFGPDICGGSRKTHAIFGYAGPNNDREVQNLEHQGNVRCESDTLSHLYTLEVKSDNTYDILIDGISVQSGNLVDKWNFLPPKQIKDPSQSKPADWVDQKEIPDPDDEEPEEWKLIPAQIPDPDAEIPDDWDEEEDGEWEPPMIDNPQYKGEWQPKMIPNPAYKGEWVHPMIDNADYFEDDQLHHRCRNCAFVGFELWQVKSGTIFDDILITDDLEVAKDAQVKFEAKRKLEKDMKKKSEEKKEEKIAEGKDVDDEFEDSEDDEPVKDEL